MTFIKKYSEKFTVNLINLNKYCTKPKHPNLGQLYQILRSSISPKSLKNNALTKSQNSSPQIHKSTGRLSFQRSSLDLNKPTQKQSITTIKYFISKKQLQDILSLNKIIELQRAIKNYNHSFNNSYFLELKKLAKVVLRETQG